MGYKVSKQGGTASFKAALRGGLFVFRGGSRMGSSKHLFWDGCDTVQLAQNYGTPLYVLSKQQYENGAVR